MGNLYSKLLLFHLSGSGTKERQVLFLIPNLQKNNLIRKVGTKFNGLALKNFFLKNSIA